MALRFPIACDQGSTLRRVWGIADPVGSVIGVTNEATPTVTTAGPHGLDVGDEVIITGVLGAVGVNSNAIDPAWIVAAAPTTTSFTVDLPAPGLFAAPVGRHAYGVVSRPRDLTGYGARMQVRPDLESEEVLIEATSDTGEFEFFVPPSSAVKNQVGLTVADEVTADIEAGSYRYDIELLRPDGSVERLVEGPFKVRREVTR